MIRIGILSIIALGLTFAAGADAPPPPPGTPVIPLWEKGAPDRLGDTEKDNPTIALFLLKDEGKHPLVVVCPGGGYGGLAMGYEGYEVAQWLNRNGVSAVVLRYRLTPYHHPVELGDAQRAIRVVRAHAAEWRVDMEKVGILGFSAGGHLASTASTHFDNGNPDAADPLDRPSCRPDFSILIYPVISMKEPYGHMGSRNNLLGENPDPKVVESLCNDEQVTEKTPPAFLVHSYADSAVPVENSIFYYLALRHAKVPAEMHLYEKGEHGYGMGKGDPILSTWTGHCVEWMKQRGIIAK